MNQHTCLSLPPGSFLRRSAVGLALLTGLLMGGKATAAVTLPFYDGIPSSYSAGGSLGATGAGSGNWTLGVPDTNIVVSATNGQSYAGLQPPASGGLGILVRKISNETTLQGVGVNFAGVTTNLNGTTTNSVYVSFLLNVISRPTASARTIATLSSGTSVPAGGNGDLSVVLTTTGTLALGRATVSPISGATTALTSGTTYLVVARYNFIPGTGVTNDTMDLWLNPTSLGVADASIPAATIANYATTVTNAASLVSFFVPKPASGSDTGTWALDEFRIGTNWASVTPSSTSVVALPFYDSFPTNYTTGSPLGYSDTGSTNWSLGTVDTNIVVTATNAQSYPGLLPPPSGSKGVLVQKISNENALAGVGVSFNPVTTNADGVTTNAVYASFLLNVIAKPTLSSRTVATLNSGTSVPAGGNGDLSVVLTTAGQLAVGRATVSPISGTTAALTAGTTYLVVTRFNFVPGGATNDTVDLWLNPTNLGVPNASMPAPTVAAYATTVANPASLVSFILPKQASGSDVATWSVDEVRLGTNWAQVTPAAVFTNLTASQSVNYGTSTLTLSGQVAAPGPLYPVSGETVTITVNGNAQTTTVSDATGDFSLNYNSTNLAYSATPYVITYAYGGDTALNATTNTGRTVTVNQAALTVTANGAGKVYNGVAFSGGNGVTYSGFVNGQTNTVLGGTLAYGGTAQGATAAGTYGIVPSGLTAANYAISYGTGTLTVSPAGLGVTANNASKAFGQTVTFAGTEFTTTALYGSDSVSGVTLTSTGATNTAAPGTYPIVISSAAGSGLTNYTINYTNGTLTVNQASPGITVGSSVNPAGYLGSVSFSATLPTNASGSVVFSSVNGAFSTNTLSAGAASSLAITNLARGTNVITAVYGGDGNYLAATNLFNQAVTNHAPAAGVMAVTITAGLGGEIALSDIATNWSDADGDAVSLAAINFTTTNGVALFPIGLATNLNGTYIITNLAYLGYTNTSNVTDQLSYSISDGFGGTNIGYINITVVAGVTGTNSITGITGGNPNVVTAYGVPGFSYITERTTNLTSGAWVNVATNTAATNGVISVSDAFSDLGGSAPAAAFYRLLWTGN